MSVENSASEAPPTQIGVADAFKAMWSRLQALLPFDSTPDPAPWFTAPPVWQNPDENPNNQQENWQGKIIGRAQYCLHHALLTGQLTARFEREGSGLDVPGWAWRNAWRFGQCLASNRLIMSPLLPDNWHDWTCAPVFLDKAAFDQWAETLQAFPVNAAPDLPLSYDATSEPAPISQRFPALGPDVSLTEATTWAAYFVAMNFYNLEYVSEGGELANIAAPRFSSLDAALFALIDAGRGSTATVEFSGRYEKRLAEHTASAPMQRIDPLQLADYRQPIWHHNALQWAPTTFDAKQANHADGFRDIRVDRAQLLAAFPARKYDMGNNTQVEPLPKRRGRTKGAGSTADADAPLIAEMKILIDEGKALSPNAAAIAVAERAAGAGTLDSKASRLAKRYRQSENN